jgi:hypothetical protein
MLVPLIIMARLFKVNASNSALTAQGYALGYRAEREVQMTIEDFTDCILMAAFTVFVVYATLIASHQYDTNLILLFQ